MRTLALGISLMMAWMSAEAVAQTTEGSIRGYVRDEQNAAMPGATITATSPTAAAPYTAVTDQEGYYRLLNMAPGDYTVIAELAGFAKFARENIVMRAGLNLTVDIVMKIGNLQETVQVVGETPLLETSKAVQAVNVSGKLQQSLPLAARRHWSEFLLLAPGAVSSDTTTDQASVFLVHGAGNSTGSTRIDGADMTSAINAWTGYVALPGSTTADVQIQTSGLDASAPLGQGATSNLVVKSGTNRLTGRGAFAYTPKAWVGNNTPGATSQTQSVVQPEVALGGPIQRDRWWFFGSYMHREGTLGLSRPENQIADMKALDPSFEPFDNAITGNIVFIKANGRLARNHEISGFYNRDATERERNSGLDTDLFTYGSVGGNGYSLRALSTWKNWLTSRVGFSWNDKSSLTYLRGNETSRPVYGTVFVSAGQLVGSTQRAALDNAASASQSPYTKWTVTGDVTMYRTGWLGSHEFQVGVSLQPHMTRKDVIQYANGGFALEELVLLDPNNAGGGTIPFHRRIYDAPDGLLALGHFADNAVYVQDAWRPTARLTINMGVRVDHVTRHDDLFPMELQNSVEVGPRLGVNYVLTSDQRNAVRASFMRQHESPVLNALSASGAGSQGGGAQTVGFRDLYDMDRDGLFEAVFPTPAASLLNPTRIIDPAYHQPFVDEWAVGYRRQFPGQVSVDVGFLHRDYQDRTALVEENAIYNGNVFVGYRDEALNEIFLVTPNRWNWPVYEALEIIGTKNTSRFQAVASYTHVLGPPGWDLAATRSGRIHPAWRVSHR